MLGHDEIGNVYGRALFTCMRSKSQEEKDQFLKHAQICLDLIADNSDAKKLLSECAVWNATFVAWLHVLIEAGRLSALGSSLLICKELMMHGRETVIVSSAHLLSPEMKEKVQSVIKIILPVCTEIVYKEDKEILAGVVIKQGWKQINLSLQDILVRAYAQMRVDL